MKIQLTKCRQPNVDNRCQPIVLEKRAGSSRDVQRSMNDESFDAGCTGEVLVHDAIVPRPDDISDLDVQLPQVRMRLDDDRVLLGSEHRQLKVPQVRTDGEKDLIDG